MTQINVTRKQVDTCRCNLQAGEQPVPSATWANAFIRGQMVPFFCSLRTEESDRSIHRQRAASQSDLLDCVQLAPRRSQSMAILVLNGLTGTMTGRDYHLNYTRTTIWAIGFQPLDPNFPIGGCPSKLTTRFFPDHCPICADGTSVVDDMKCSSM